MPKQKKVSIKKSTASGRSATKLTKKQVQSTARALRHAFESKKLAAIERLLGEDFDNLRQAKKELKRNTVQVKRTAKATIREAKSLAKVFRDAFGRFDGAQGTGKGTQSKRRKIKPTGGQPQTAGPVSGKKTKRTGSQPKPSSASVIPPAKKSTSAKPKKSITFRTLKPRKGETLLQLLDRLESMGPMADMLLKPGERWIFTYGNGRSKRAWPNLDLAIRRMREYKLSQGTINGAYAEGYYNLTGIETEDDLVTSIGFAKTTQGFGAYEQMRHDENEVRKNERRRHYREVDKLLADNGIAVKKFGGDLTRSEGLLELMKRKNRKGKSK